MELLPPYTDVFKLPVGVGLSERGKRYEKWITLVNDLAHGKSKVLRKEADKMAKQLCKQYLYGQSAMHQRFHRKEVVKVDVNDAIRLLLSMKSKLSQPEFDALYNQLCKVQEGIEGI